MGKTVSQPMALLDVVEHLAVVLVLMVVVAAQIPVSGRQQVYDLAELALDAMTT